VILTIYSELAMSASNSLTKNDKSVLAYLVLASIATAD